MGFFCSFAAMGDHVAAKLYLAFIIGRSIDGHDHIGTHRDHVVGRIVLIEPLFPKGLVIPKVLADDNAELDSIHLKNASLVAGLKVSRVVENIVFRKQ